MARAYFDQNPFAAAPIEPGLDIIRRTYSQRAPSPMDNLSKAIEQPFVTDVLVPGISRIRDELRISEQEDLIAEQAQARKDAARSAMGQAFFRETQAKMPEVPTMPSLASLSDSGVVDDQYIGTVSRQLEAMVAQGASPGQLRQAVGAMTQLGMAAVARDILQGGTAQESLRAAQVDSLKSQLRRQVAAPMPEAQPAVQQETLTIRDGVPRFSTGAPADDPNRLAVRAYRKHLDANPGDTDGAMAAAQQAAGASAPQAAAAQAIERPELLEEAAAFREQAAVAEAEAEKIAATRVRVDFADYAVDFMDALDADDKDLQREILRSVGGATDVQNYGKGAVAGAITSKAGAGARKALLDLKGKYLEAQRKEASALKIVERRAELKADAKKAKRTGKGGGGYGKKDQVRLRILGNLNNNTPLSGDDRDALKKLGLTSGEISRIKPGSAGRESWTAITRGMGRRAYSRAQNIMRGQATVEEREVREGAWMEREAARLIKEAATTANADDAKAKRKQAADLNKAAAKLRKENRQETQELARAKEDRARADRAEVALAKAKELAAKLQGIVDNKGYGGKNSEWVDIAGEVLKVQEGRLVRADAEVKRLVTKITKLGGGK